MKQKVILLALSVAAALLSGCGERNAQDNTTGTGASQPATPPAATSTPPVPPAMTNSTSTNSP